MKGKTVFEIDELNELIGTKSKPKRLPDKFIKPILPKTSKKKLSKNAQLSFGLEELPGKRGYVKTVKIDPKARDTKDTKDNLRLAKKKPLKKKAAVSKKVVQKRVKSPPNDSHFILGLELVDEIQKNKQCYVIEASATAAVFVKRIEVSVTKINENSVFQPHEKTGKKVYCIVVVFEFNRMMEELNPRRFTMSDISNAYKPLIERGANVYYIYDISQVEGIIDSIE